MKTNIKKLTMSAVIVAISVACSTLSIPVGASRCFPVQHLANIVAGVFLGPWYALGTAFVTSLIRNILGTGSLLAFPGSMVGAFLGGFLYQKFNRLPLAYIGELFGTGIIGALLAYPIAKLIIGNGTAVLFTYIIPFSVSSLGGTIIAIFFVQALKRTKVFDELLEERKNA